MSTKKIVRLWNASNRIRYFAAPCGRYERCVTCNDPETADCNAFLAFTELSAAVADLKGDEETFDGHVCSWCKAPMSSGYVIGDGERYYCDSTLCLERGCPDYAELHEADPDSNYWTEWE